MRRKYDEEEDALIMQVPDNYLGNLSEGFRELSKLLDRDAISIANRYYYLKKTYKKQDYSFIMASKNTVIYDNKICKSFKRNTYNIKLISKVWNYIHKLFKK